MSKYEFSPQQRFAIFSVHGERCYLCSHPVDLKTMEVDHVSPDLGLPKPLPSIVRSSAQKVAAGSTVLITGQNFLGTTSVKIGSKSVRFKVRAPQYLEVKRPASLRRGSWK